MLRLGITLLLPIALFAQCSLTVSVEDASAGRIANATVRLRDQTTSRVLSAVTTAEGLATFLAVPCSPYQLTAAYTGFEESSTAVRLTERTPSQVKLTLRTRTPEKPEP